MFDRDARMATCQIMSYDVDAKEQWCFLIGLYQGAPGQVNAHMQLFNFERKQQQMLEGFSACFIDIPITDGNNSHINNLFCFVEKKAGETASRLHVMEIGAPAPGANKFKITVDVAMAADAPGDFPILMQPCAKYGLIFVVTKMGYFFMYEASKGALIYRQRITDQLIFASVRNA